MRVPILTTAIDGVRICKTDHAVSPESSMSGTVLAVIAQGGKRLALGDRVYEYGAGQYLVASVDLPVTGHVIDATPGHPTLAFGMTLEPAAIAELLLRAGPGDLPRSPGTVRPGIAVSVAPDELLDAISHDIGCSPAQVALSWVRQQPGSVIPLVAARTEEQFLDNLGAIDVHLSRQHLDRLDELSRPTLGFPGDVMREASVVAGIYGAQLPDIDDPRGQAVRSTTTSA